MTFLPVESLFTVVTQELVRNSKFGLRMAIGITVMWALPLAFASQPYTNPDGSKFGGCQYCGYCQRFGCEANAKGSPHMTVIPIAMRNPNFELRTNSWVTKVLKDSDGKRVTGVTYTNLLDGEEFEQPATIVLLCAFAINNVHLMLLSGIGTP